MELRNGLYMCDRCGSEWIRTDQVGDDTDKAIYSMRMVNCSYETLTGENSVVNGIDLCSQCREDLLHFFKEFRVGETK